MFTGIVQCMGELVDREPCGGDVRLSVDVSGLLADEPEDSLTIGESVSVNGACLTVVAFAAGRAAFDVSNETLALTLLGKYPLGERLNLERALRARDRLGGHFVTGHVDGIGELLTLDRDARSWRMTFAAPLSLAPYLAPKGSICIDGVSLTVNGVSDRQRFCAMDVNIVPHTLSVTALGGREPGAEVHLEVDLIARYLQRLLADQSPAV